MTENLPEPLCRQKRQALGLPYPKSGCAKCGSIIRFGWRCAEVADEASEPSPAILRTLGTAIKEIERLNGVVAAFDRELTRSQGVAIRYRTALLAISEMKTVANMQRVADGALADAPVAAAAILETAP